MTIHFHPAPKPAPTVKPPKGLRKKNTARVAENFKRAYGSIARVKFVNLRHCAACGAWGYSENAHLLGNDGGSRKGHFTTIGPLCGVRPDDQGGVYQGCHNLFDEHGDEFAARFPTFNPRRVAAKTQRDWIAFVRSGQR